MIPKSKLTYITEKIQRDCTSCDGESCGVCRSKSARICRYAAANIPVDYWELSWKDFAGDKKFKEVVSEILSNLNKIYEEGQSFAFVGNLGVGKTYAACSILKLAIMSDFSAEYTTMTDVITNILSPGADTQRYANYLMEKDFILIDEFDIRHVSPSEKAEKVFGMTLEHILRSRFQNRMPTIICSNTGDLDTVLAGEFGRAFSSLKNKYMKVYEVTGKDFRKNGSR